MGTPNIGESIMIWQKLGFTLLQMDNQPYPWAQLSDGSLQLMLNQDGLEYLGLLYFSDDVASSKKKLKAQGLEPVFSTGPDDPVFHIIYSDPDENLAGITEGEQVRDNPGKRFIHLSKEEYDNPKAYPNPACGIFGELSMPVRDLKESMAFWKKMGFQEKMSESGNQPWATLDDGLATIGLYQTKEFDRPSLTFFARDMEKRIGRLSKDGLSGIKPWKGRGGAESNAVAELPSGFEVFLFSF